MRAAGIVEILLRISVAFAFVYPAIAGFVDPLSWVGFFPVFLRDIIPNETLLLLVFGISELVIALWILVGRNIFIPSTLAAIYLFLIVILNLSLLDILFRDISIFLIALALALLHYKNNGHAHGASGHN